MTDTSETPATPSSQDTIGHDSDRGPDPAGTRPTEPDGISPPTATLIAAITAAVTRGASAEARAAGVTACRSLLTVLDAKPGQALVATAPPAASPASSLLAMIKQPGFLNQLAAMSREQLLDLLRQATGALPAKAASPTTQGPRFHIVDLPPRVRR